MVSWLYMVTDRHKFRFVLWVTVAAAPHGFPAVPAYLSFSILFPTTGLADLEPEQQTIQV